MMIGRLALPMITASFPISFFPLFSAVSSFALVVNYQTVSIRAEWASAVCGTFSVSPIGSRSEYLNPSVYSAMLDTIPDFPEQIPESPVVVAGFFFAKPRRDLPPFPSKPIPLELVRSYTSEEWTPEFRLSDLIALLTTLPPTLTPGKVRERQNQALPMRITLHCRFCGVEHFTVRFSLPLRIFHITVEAFCLCRAVPWRVFDPSPPDRSHLYMLDCSRQAERNVFRAKLAPCPLFAKIAKRALTDPDVSVTVLDFFRKFAYTNRWLRELTHIERHDLSLVDFINNLSGFRMVRFTRATAGMDPRTIVPIEDGHLIGLTWIPNWALAVFEIAEFIELDCSHDAVPLYAYCIPHAVLHNESVPIGLIITPTERAMTYEWFYTDLETMAGKKLPKKPVLSDEGEAVREFCLARALLTFFCFFHLLYKWRRYRILLLLAKRILRIPTEARFEAELPEIAFQLDLIRQAELVPAPVITDFTKFLGWPDYDNHPEKRNPFAHGLWLRADFGKPGPNTHEERFHRTVAGRAVRKAGRSIASHLDVIRGAMVEKFDEFLRGSNAQLRRFLRDLIARSVHADDDPDCARDACLVSRELWKTRFGLEDIPCKHQVHDLKVNDVLARLTHFGDDPPKVDIGPTLQEVQT
jgi:hypothetical protein